VHESARDRPACQTDARSSECRQVCHPTNRGAKRLPTVRSAIMGTPFPSSIHAAVQNTFNLQRHLMYRSTLWALKDGSGGAMTPCPCSSVRSAHPTLRCFLHWCLVTAPQEGTPLHFSSRPARGPLLPVSYSTIGSTRSSIPVDLRGAPPPHVAQGHAAIDDRVQPDTAGARLVGFCIRAKACLRRPGTASRSAPPPKISAKPRWTS